MKAKTEVRIGIITAGVSAVPCIHKLVSSALLAGTDMIVISTSLCELAIYALYIFSLVTKRLQVAKCIYIVWWLSALRMVLFLTFLLQYHQYAKAFLIGSEVGLKAIFLWIGINGLKRCTKLAAKQIDERTQETQ